ncbi:hypothetical protein C2U70_29780 [Bradyrhizobium guangdongense]|nr:hypothetical protein C2U70_29780 [Bradyrhizobium guangdongense]
MSQDDPVAGIESGDVIQVVSRAFDILRCFESRSQRLGNRDIANRCGLPRSTVSRLTLTLTRIGQLIYLPQEQKYVLNPAAFALGATLIPETCDTAEQGVHDSARAHRAEEQFAL